MRLGKVGIRLDFFDLGQGADVERPQFAVAAGGADPHRVLPQSAIRRDGELHLHGVVDRLQGFHLDARRIEENLLRVGQAGAVEGHVGLDPASAPTGEMVPTLGLADQAGEPAIAAHAETARATVKPVDRTYVMLLLRMLFNLPANVGNRRW